VLLIAGIPRLVGAQGQPPPAAPEPPSAISVISRSLEPGAKIPDRRPPIEVVFQDRQRLVDPGRITMTLDEADVTGFLKIAPDRVSYTPPSGLPAGQRRVQVNLVGKDGQTLQTVG